MLTSQFNNRAKLHLEALRCHAYKLTLDTDDAEDLLQETLTRGFLKRNQYREDTNFKAWLFKIMTNLFISEFRRKRRHVHTISLNNETESEVNRKLDLTHRLFSFIDAPVDQTLETFDDRTKTCFDSLRKPYQMILFLCDIEEYSYREIANILNIPIGTVMSRLHRARKLLKKALLKYKNNEKTGQ